MKSKYGKMTDADFDSILEEILNEHTGSQLLLIPGVYECVSEHFNNEVLDRWEQENPDKIPEECRDE